MLRSELDDASSAGRESSAGSSQPGDIREEGRSFRSWMIWILPTLGFNHLFDLSFLSSFPN